jgi:hypothetical protein
MSQQQQKKQQQGTSGLKRPDPKGRASSPNQQGQPHRYDDVAYKGQVREALLRRAAVATIRDDIPIVSAVTVRESRIAAEEHEDRLHDAELRAALAVSDVALPIRAEEERVEKSSPKWGIRFHDID